jgi:hypothetical protein
VDCSDVSREVKGGIIHARVLEQAQKATKSRGFIVRPAAKRIKETLESHKWRDGEFSLGDLTKAGTGSFASGAAVLDCVDQGATVEEGQSQAWRSRSM